MPFLSQEFTPNTRGSLYRVLKATFQKCVLQVREVRYAVLYLGPHTITPSMTKSVLSGICGKGKWAGDASDVKREDPVGVVADAGLCKTCVGRLQRDIILGKVPFVFLSVAFRSQEFRRA